MYSLNIPSLLAIKLKIIFLKRHPKGQLLWKVHIVLRLFLTVGSLGTTLLLWQSSSLRAAPGAP